MLHRKMITIRELETELKDWRERINVIRHKLKFINILPGVACITDLNPLQTAAGSIPALVELAGGLDVEAYGGRIELPPDIIIMMQSGKGMEEQLSTMASLMEQPWFTGSPAFSDGRVYVMNSRDYPDRPGPDRINLLEILAEIINTDDFYFGFEGKAWMHFATAN